MRPTPGCRFVGAGTGVHEVVSEGVELPGIGFRVSGLGVNAGRPKEARKGAKIEARKVAKACEVDLYIVCKRPVPSLPPKVHPLYQRLIFTSP